MLLGPHVEIKEKQERLVYSYLLQLVYEYMLLVLGTCTKETRKDLEGESSALILEEGNTLILFGWATQGN